ncbi:MAG TPA: MFS transporter [Ramlibacter sp.]|nr:MFS transporter [Ramlibacter sp.]
MLPVLFLSTALHVVTVAQVFTVPAIAPAMAATLGVSESLVGAQVILVYMAAMVASMFAGSLVVQVGAVRATQLSLVGAAIGLGLSAIPSVVVVVTASLLLGAAYGLVNPATGQMLDSGIDPARRGTAFSIKQSAVPVGGVLAGAIAPVIAVSIGWQGSLLAMAASAVAGALLLETRRHWFPFQRPPSGRESTRPFRDVHVILQTPALRFTCLAVAAFAGVQLILTTYLVTILVQHVGLGLVAAGVALSFFNGGGMVGRFGWGLASDAVPGSLVLAFVFGLSLMLLLVFPFVEADWPIVLLHGFVAAMGIAVAGWAGVFVSEVLRLAPPNESARAIAGGYVFTFGGGLGGLGCFLLGFHVLGSYGATLWIVAAMATVGFLLSLKAASILAVSRHLRALPGAKQPR